MSHSQHIKHTVKGKMLWDGLWHLALCFALKGTPYLSALKIDPLGWPKRHPQACRLALGYCLAIVVLVPLVSFALAWGLFHSLSSLLLPNAMLTGLPMELPRLEEWLTTVGYWEAMIALGMTFGAIFHIKSAASPSEKEKQWRAPLMESLTHSSREWRVFPSAFWSWIRRFFFDPLELGVWNASNTHQRVIVLFLWGVSWVAWETIKSPHRSAISTIGGLASVPIGAFFLSLWLMHIAVKKGRKWVHTSTMKSFSIKKMIEKSCTVGKNLSTLASAVLQSRQTVYHRVCAAVVLLFPWICCAGWVMMLRYACIFWLQTHNSLTAAHWVASDSWASEVGVAQLALLIVSFFFSWWASLLQSLKTVWGSFKNPGGTGIGSAFKVPAGASLGWVEQAYQLSKQVVLHKSGWLGVVQYCGVLLYKSGAKNLSKVGLLLLLAAAVEGFLCQIVGGKSATENLILYGRGCLRNGEFASFFVVKIIFGFPMSMIFSCMIPAILLSIGELSHAVQNAGRQLMEISKSAGAHRIARQEAAELAEVIGGGVDASVNSLSRSSESTQTIGSPRPVRATRRL